MATPALNQARSYRSKVVSKHELCSDSGLKLRAQPAVPLAFEQTSAGCEKSFWLAATLVQLRIRFAASSRGREFRGWPRRNYRFVMDHIDSNGSFLGCSSLEIIDKLLNKLALESPQRACCINIVQNRFPEITPRCKFISRS